jgi:hypothetical protein
MLRATNTTAIAVTGVYESINSAAENMAYSLAHGGHEC